MARTSMVWILVSGCVFSLFYAISFTNRDFGLGSVAILLAVAMSCTAKFTGTTSMASIKLDGFVSDFKPLGGLTKNLAAYPSATSFGNMSTVQYFGLVALPDVYHFGISGI
jgi:hypothetical protein